MSRGRRGSAEAGRRVWPAGDDHRARAVGMALAVAGAYYIGARLGFLFELAPGPTSVLWPPNAILTAALLLTPVRRWWLPVLAVAPAHVLVQAGVVQPPSLIAALFLTNWSEALLAAVGVRLVAGGPGGLDTLRRTASFILAAGLVAPFVSSFADAAAVATLAGHDYWTVWRTRFFANVLTELTLASAIVAAAASRWRWRESSASRRVEAVLLGLVLVVVGLSVLDSNLGPRVGVPAMTGALLLLPVLLWAAVRFGPAGCSGSLLLVAGFAVWGAHHGRGPLAGVPPDDRVVVLQLSLTVVTIPLLCLAAVVTERRHAAVALAESLRFEELLSGLAGACVRLPTEQVDDAIRDWLARLGAVLPLRGLTLSRVADDGRAIEWYSWQAPSAPERDGSETEPQSTVVIPLVARGRRLGDLTLEFRTRRLRPSESWTSRLTVVAEVLASTLADNEAETAVRASESLKSAILASVTTRVAVLGRSARVIAVNEAWSRSACEPGLGTEPAIGVGDNYLEHWRRLVGGDDAAYAHAVAVGIEKVLDGKARAFSIDYSWRPSAEDRRQWWAMSVVPLTHPDGGAVVSLADLTARRRAEMEAQQMRQELAHVARVSTMGELTASLAHELNQPLTAILANAQAARRFLDTAAPDVDELRAILVDIAHDGHRAGEIIHRLREMLAKREVDFQALDLNVLVEDVIKLLSSDLLIHNIGIATDLSPDLPRVKGDRIQLQQVVLNLLLNAIDAISADRSVNERRIVVRTAAPHRVQISVCDSGHGLPRDIRDLVFQPFFTTKSSGMGMGLAIARSIIEAHGGMIWATDNPVRGTTFHFALAVDPTAGRE